MSNLAQAAMENFGDRATDRSSDKLVVMLRGSRLQRPLLWMLILALLIVRVGGAHLHLCFDGGEAPQSFHLMDVGIHHAGNGVENSHDDVDIALAGDLLVKSSKSSFDFPLALLSVLLAWTLVQFRQPFVSRLTKLVVATAPHLVRPPTRGPPLISH